jgi:cytochrome c-type biogenesis protein CcmH/NrfG
MLSVVVMVTVVVATLIGWGWWGRWRTRTALLPLRDMPHEALALEAFMQGNAYLAEEKFREATAAFHQARELDPKRAHVADRLAEVARRQHAMTATLPVTSHP